MEEYSKSIIQENKCCYICGMTGKLHRHHIFFGSANRKVSEEDGCWCWLCPAHHNMSGTGVHFNHELDEKLKQQAEKIWIKTYVPDLDEEQQITLMIILIL